MGLRAHSKRPGGSGPWLLLSVAGLVSACGSGITRPLVAGSDGVQVGRGTGVGGRGTGAGGRATGAAGSSSCSAGAGGAAAGGASGAGGSAGADRPGGTGGGTGGASGTPGTDAGGGTGGGAAVDAGGEFGQPACPGTVFKAGACTSTDIQFCYKTCGPESVGAKSEVCSSAGVYEEMAGCAFDPARDYSCYKIPTTASSACAAGVTPMAAAPCTAPPCMVCNSTGGITGGLYLDSSGAAKNGYCVCTSSGKWSCATTVNWPCPAGSGC